MTICKTDHVIKVRVFEILFKYFANFYLYFFVFLFHVFELRWNKYLLVDNEHDRTKLKMW